MMMKVETYNLIRKLLISVYLDRFLGKSYIIPTPTYLTWPLENITYIMLHGRNI